MSQKADKTAETGSIELILVNTETGEVVGEGIHVIKADEPSAGRYTGRRFWRLYMNGFLAVLDGLQGRQIKVLIHILGKMQPSDNRFFGTYRSISEYCGLSLDAVRRAMLRLRETGFLLKEQNGNYFVSPKILVKGDENKRIRLKKQFQEAEQKTERDRDRRFWKLYMSDFLAVLDRLEGRQVTVLAHILKHTDPSGNRFVGTYRSISEHCGASLDTVRRTMLRLQEIGFIVKIQNGNYFISPNILINGNDYKREELERQFKMAEQRRRRSAG